MPVPAPVTSATFCGVAISRPPDNFHIIVIARGGGQCSRIGHFDREEIGGRRSSGRSGRGSPADAGRGKRRNRKAPITPPALLTRALSPLPTPPAPSPAP